MTVLDGYADKFDDEANKIDAALQNAVLSPPSDAAALALWKTQYDLFAQKAKSMRSIAASLRSLDALNELNGLGNALANLEGATQHAKDQISQIADINHQFDVLQKFVAVGLAIVTAVTTGGATSVSVVTAVTTLLTTISTYEKQEQPLYGPHPANG